MVYMCMYSMYANKCFLRSILIPAEYWTKTSGDLNIFDQLLQLKWKYIANINGLKNYALLFGILSVRHL